MGVGSSSRLQQGGATLILPTLDFSLGREGFDLIPTPGWRRCRAISWDFSRTPTSSRRRFWNVAMTGLGRITRWSCSSPICLYFACIFVWVVSAATASLFIDSVALHRQLRRSPSLCVAREVDALMALLSILARSHPRPAGVCTGWPPTAGHKRGSQDQCF